MNYLVSRGLGFIRSDISATETFGVTFKHQTFLKASKKIQFKFNIYIVCSKFGEDLLWWVIFNSTEFTSITINYKLLFVCYSWISLNKRWILHQNRFHILQSFSVFLFIFVLRLISNIKNVLKSDKTSKTQMYVCISLSLNLTLTLNFIYTLLYGGVLSCCCQIRTMFPVKLQ